MATAIIMPKAGMAMEEGTVMKWLKAEGQQVEQGDPLLEILTDKVVMEVEAQVSGTLIKILKEEGEVVPVTKIIGYLGEAGEKAPEAETEGTPEAAIAKTAAAESEKEEEKKILEVKPAAKAETEIKINTADFSGKPAATPAAKRIAGERGIDLLKVRGSGENGEIKARDVEAYKEVSISPLARRAAEAEGIDVTELRGSGHAGKILMKDVEGKLQEAAGGQGAPAAVNIQEAGKGKLEAGQLTADGKEIAEVIPYSGVRKVIGQRMVESKFTAPHLYFTQKVDLEKLLDVRKTVNGSQEKKTSVTDYISKAVIKAIKKYPDFNQSLSGDK